MLLTCSEMRALEERAFADGISAEALMDEAGAKIAAAVAQFFPVPGRCVLFAGKGHNGGDGFVAARWLREQGWEVEVREAFPRPSAAPLTQKKARELEEGRTTGSSGMPGMSRRPLVALDGLLGIGAGGALREPVRGMCREINRLRREENAQVFALDLPSGLDGDSGEADPDAVVADTTLTIGFAKSGLLADRAVDFVGRLAVLPLRELSRRATQGGAAVASAPVLAPLLARRPFDTHKGGCGRVGVVAGARGYVGAAVLCAEAAVRAGAGLVTLYVPEAIYAVVAARVGPEVMVRMVDSLLEVLEMRHDALAVGPGMGRERDGEARALIARALPPMVVDADAINALAGDLAVLEACAGPRLLTPHPGEMARLDPEVRLRRETVEAFTGRWPHALLLKGARSIVGQRGRLLSYNSTGHPGLATGGMGDVLTGLCAGLAGQGLGLFDAARLGAWLLGRAAEVAVFEGGESAESLRPTSVLERFGCAFADLRAGVF